MLVVRYNLWREGGIRICPLPNSPIRLHPHILTYTNIYLRASCLALPNGDYVRPISTRYPKAMGAQHASSPTTGYPTFVLIPRLSRFTYAKLFLEHQTPPTPEPHTCRSHLFYTHLEYSLRAGRSKFDGQLQRIVKSFHSAECFSKRYIDSFILFDAVGENLGVIGDIEKTLGEYF